MEQGGQHTPTPLIKAHTLASSIEGLTNYYESSSLTPLTGSVRDVLGRAVERRHVKKKPARLRNEGGSIDYLFLSEANEWLNKTVYSLFAYKTLQLGRYASWALATLYYSRFFLNCGLSRLQGCALTHGKPWFRLLIARDIKSGFYMASKPRRGSFHRLTWDLARDCYRSFSPEGLESLTKGAIETYFGGEGILRELGMREPYRPEMRAREERTYDPYGFDELFYADLVYERRARREEELNFIDEEVFQAEVDRQAVPDGDFDGTGVNEACHGQLLEFFMELCGRIGQALPKHRLFYLRWNHLSDLDTNEDTNRTVLEWASKYGIGVV
jgi:hypothetical protein